MVGTEIELYCTIHSFILSFIQEVGRKRGWGGVEPCAPPTPFRNLYKQHGFPPQVTCSWSSPPPPPPPPPSLLW